jgi:hypothetical protein
VKGSGRSGRQKGERLLSTPPPLRLQSADDGLWHQVALTTQAGGGKGFQLYLDGQLVGEMSGSQLYEGRGVTRSSLEGLLVS